MAGATVHEDLTKVINTFKLFFTHFIYNSCQCCGYGMFYPGSDPNQKITPSRIQIRCILHNQNIFPIAAGDGGGAHEGVQGQVQAGLPDA
jgi:predicted nucleic-acid-binding Zn-ribbon protein